jgi:hypothetical protein
VQVSARARSPACTAFQSWTQAPRQDRSDHAMGAERGRRVEQCVDRAEDAVLRPRRDQEIRQKLEVARTLLDPITPSTAAAPARPARRRLQIPQLPLA